jgi:hypothetical protein
MTGSNVTAARRSVLAANAIQKLEDYRDRAASTAGQLP